MRYKNFISVSFLSLLLYSCSGKQQPEKADPNQLKKEDIAILEETFSALEAKEKRTLIDKMGEENVEKCPKIKEFCEKNSVRSSRRSIDTMSLLSSTGEILSLNCIKDLVGELPIPVRLMFSFVTVSAVTIPTMGAGAAFILAPLGLLLAGYVIATYWDDIVLVVEKIKATLERPESGETLRATTIKKNILSFFSQVEETRRVSSRIPERIKGGKYKIDLTLFTIQPDRVFEGWSIEVNKSGKASWVLKAKDKIAAYLDKSGKILVGVA